jgi:hypothetical protein
MRSPQLNCGIAAGRGRRVMAGSASARPRQEADHGCQGPAGQGQLTVAVGQTRKWPSLCENPLTPRLTDP